MELHLIRHGRTQANEKKLYCGRTDLPLSEGGADEIARFVKQNIYPPSEVVYVSGLVRTVQTAGLAYPGVTKITLPEIAEYNFGLFEMKGYEELRRRGDYQAWISDAAGGVCCPDGESKNMFTTRVMSGFARINAESLREARASVAAVCHGGTITCIMENLFPGRLNYYEWQPGSGRGYTLTLISGKAAGYAPI